MILDTIENAHRYQSLHPGFGRAFEFLGRSDLNELSPGTHEIDGKKVYAVVAQGPGRDKRDAHLEIHRRYIDIQYVVAGTDEIGWKPTASCERPTGEYDPQKDLQFFADEPDVWTRVGPARFAVFFPEDAHLPMISADPLHKVVVKVACDGFFGVR